MAVFFLNREGETLSIFWILVWFSSELELDPVPLELGRDNCRQLCSDGSILVGGHGKVFHWQADGKLLMTLPLVGYPEYSKEKPVSFCAYLNDVYWVTLKSRPTLFFDKNGDPVALHPDSARPSISYLNVVGGRYFWPQQDLDFLRANNFAFMANEVRLLQTHQGLQLETSGLQFCKAYPAMHERLFNFKRIYLARGNKRNGENILYYAMNQLENRIYAYSPAVVKKEYEDGERKSTPVPFEVIPLAKYRTRPVKLFDPGFSFYEGEAKKQVDRKFSEWWNRLGLISSFHKYSQGYVITYEIPDIDEQGRCNSYHQGLQTLSQTFKPNGALKEISGQPLGIQRTEGGEERFLFLDIKEMPDSKLVTPLIRFVEL